MFAAASREVRAVARLASLMMREREPALPEGVAPGDDVVVFVHGFLTTAGAMRPLRDRLERRAGARTTGFTYGSVLGVAQVAQVLGRLVDQLPSHARIHLVGHSLGGLAVRWYVQQIRRDPRVVQTICIAAPFEGARGARWVPGVVGRDIRANSPVLQRLDQSADAARDLPHLTILGALDTAIPIRTRGPVGERVIIADCGHNGLLFHPAVGDAVVARVLASRALRAASA